MLKKTTRWITRILNWFCLIAMLGLSVIVALQVVSRLMKISLPWTEELARFLADRAGSGAGDVAFVIGSSHGLADEVKRAAALKFSMGRITMPHQLARLVLTEQLYRACTINVGMKYHK